LVLRSKNQQSFYKIWRIRQTQFSTYRVSQDYTIPKFATHLIYLTKADRRHEIEDKVIKSIFAKKPKRADVLVLHINRTEDPFTLSYDVSELVEDRVIKVNINVGF
jgi:KUP system potassium uptake protein